VEPTTPLDPRQRASETPYREEVDEEDVGAAAGEAAAAAEIGTVTEPPEEGAERLVRRPSSATRTA
jgi:hypothetical protein